MISELNRTSSTENVSPPEERFSAGELSRGKRRLFRVVTILLSLALSVVAAELILRIAGWPAPGFYANGRGPITLRVPGQIGGAYPPNTSGRLKHYDYDVGCVVNGDGFRERNPTQKAKGEWRLGILGDSFTVGVGVEQSERFSDVWSVGIRQQLPNVTLWNLGSPVCGTLCEAKMLDGLGPKYDLDEIVLVFYGGNDLEDNLEEYRQQDSRSTATSVPAEGLRGWLREHSRVATFAWVNTIRAFASIRPPGVYSEAKLAQTWPATQRALTEFKQVAGSRPVTILYIPSVAEWDDEIWKKMGHYSDVASDGRFLVKQAVANWTKENGINFLDTTPWLRSCQTNTECIFPVDGHWNVHAHVLVGQELIAHWKEK